MNHKEITKQRVITFLTREELEFMDKLENDIRFSTGKFISRSEIMEALADLLTKTKMDAVGIKNHEELKQKILEAIAKECGELLKKEQT